MRKKSRAFCFSGFFCGKMKASIEEDSWRVETEENINTKKKKRKVKEDTLSNLPDEIILHILSFLEAKTAVQMSVLSKRWRYLWTSLPVLDFLGSSFDDPVIFRCFVQHVLSRKDASNNLNMLKLVCDHDSFNFFDDDDIDMVHSIIDYVKPTNIQALSILAECFIGNLPQLSVCRSLTTLHLAYIATDSAMFDSVSLQHLHLYTCEFEYWVEENDPFGGCPNLRCLSLIDCSYIGDIQKFQIHAPQLTNLTISNMTKNSDFAIELFTPKLQSFSYSDNYYLYDFLIKGKGKLPFVERVNIDLGDFRLHGKFPKATNLSLKLSKLFEAMESAEFVSLSPRIIQVLSMVPPLLYGRSSPFTRLKNFDLIKKRGYPVTIPTNVMAYLFGGSPGFDCGRHGKGIILNKDLDPHRS
ncbi:putative FBD-associated F-box protein At5g22720 [Gastrolobium bilobum]|uniref:putative FBD-associated F-box protein At5g22720 n=1 Tax=Gastrolobium bilobum TaxID=150636 RepID=UPI002AAF547E|nr:putative FBD-associated F-box protein At5g22720 [Gastrolobium bilobum]